MLIVVRARVGYHMIWICPHPRLCLFLDFFAQGTLSLVESFGGSLGSRKGVAFVQEQRPGDMIRSSIRTTMKELTKRPIP
ncbi:MAG: hypothetical protein J3Q66DRAFT_328244 [Benniella sp.]|nr:MAG: hypothetical protein J3Q66DRAFT_328244 [Benniella sp.]